MRAVLEYLTPTQRELRKSMGCDAHAKEPRYAVLCPRCDGTRTANDGTECSYCIPSGKLRGMVPQHRCPSSQITPDIGRAMRAYRWADSGTGFPEPGGELDQSPSWLQFANIYGAEISRVQDTEREAERLKAESKSKLKKGKR